MEIAFIEPLQRGWARMRALLFEPFAARVWLVVGFAAWLAGLLDGHPGTSIGSRLQGDHGGGHWGGGAFDLFHALGLGLLAFVLLTFALALLVLCLWASSRGKFVFLDDIVRAEAAIVAPWRQHAVLGDSLFLWRLGFTAVVMLLAMLLTLPFLVLTGVTAGAGWSEVSIATIVFFTIAMSTIVAIPAAYTALLLDSFIVPMMYRYQLSAPDAWRRFLPILRQHLAHFVIYGVVLLLIHVVVAVVLIGVGLMTCCLGLLVLGTPYIGTVVTLPIWVALRCFSLEFIGQIDPELRLLAGDTPQSGGA